MQMCQSETDKCCGQHIVLPFFVFLRIGEMVGNVYDPNVHLSLSDVSVDKPEWPTMLKISIKQSKADPFRKGGLILSQDGHRHLPTQGPLFILEDESFLTPHYVMSAVRDALQRAGVDQTRCGHSFQVGAATMAAARGMEDSGIIKTLGRWQSVA